MYTIFVAMVVSNIFMLVFQLGGVRLFARALMVPPHLLNALVLILSIIGAFALESSIFDAFAAVAFGILGWWMKKAGYPVIPLVLGLDPRSDARVGIPPGRHARGHVYDVLSPVRSAWCSCCSARPTWCIKRFKMRREAAVRPKREVPRDASVFSRHRAPRRKSPRCGARATRCRRIRQLGGRNRRRNACAYLEPGIIIDHPPTLTSQAWDAGVDLSAVNHWSLPTGIWTISIPTSFAGGKGTGAKEPKAPLPSSPGTTGCLT